MPRYSKLYQLKGLKLKQFVSLAYICLGVQYLQCLKLILLNNIGFFFYSLDLYLVDISEPLKIFQGPRDWELYWVQTNYVAIIAILDSSRNPTKNHMSSKISILSPKGIFRVSHVRGCSQIMSAKNGGVQTAPPPFVSYCQHFPNPLSPLCQPLSAFPQRPLPLCQNC